LNIRICTGGYTTVEGPKDKQENLTISPQMGSLRLSYFKREIVMNTRNGVITIPFIHNPTGLKALCRQHNVRLLVAFGSRVTGSPPPSPDSDLDLALLLKSGHAERSADLLIRHLPDFFPTYDVDLVFLNRADPLLRYEIMRESILLYGNMDEYAAYQVFSHRDLMDSRALLELEERLFEKKMAYIRSRGPENRSPRPGNLKNDSC
jgi:predicted nucleotidyltransferase